MQWVITKTACDGIGNVLKGFVSALSVNPTATIECNPDYMYGRYEEVLDSCHIYTGGDAEPFYTCRLLVLKSEEPWQDTIVNEFQFTNGCGNPRLNGWYSLDRLIDWNYDVSRIHPTVRDRIQRTIRSIRILPQVYEWVSNWTRQFQGETVLGISVRTWTASHEQNVSRPYNSAVYKQAITDHISGVSTVVLSVDTDTVCSEYEEFLRQFPVPVLVLRKQPGETDLQHAFVKMLTLSKCTHLIANRISTFTELVFWFSNCTVQVTPLF